MKKLVALFLAIVFAVGPGVAAVGSWNGVAFTQWNGVAQTSWNGTAISCASSGVTLISSVVGAGLNTYSVGPISTTGATLLVVGYIYLTGAEPTLSDSGSNTWAPLTASVNGSSGASIRIRYVNSATPTTSGTHSFTLTGASQISSVTVAAFSGTGAAPFQSQNGATGAGATSLAAGSVTPSVDGSVLIALLGIDTVVTPTIDTGFTAFTNNPLAGGNNFGSRMAYFVQPTAAAINPLWSWSGSANPAARIASFK